MKNKNIISKEKQQNYYHYYQVKLRHGKVYLILCLRIIYYFKKISSYILGKHFIEKTES